MTKISLSKNLFLLNLMLSSEEKIKFISEEFQEHINLMSFLSKELFSPFIVQSLLFLSFLVATFIPAIILRIKNI